MMRKLLTILTALLLTAGLAMAYGPGYGRGMGGGGNGYNQGSPCYGQGYGPGMRGYRNQGEIKQLTEKDAKAAFDKFLAENLKGYTYEKIDKLNVPRGTMYSVNVKDANGNEFILHLNPWGYVRGPFPVTK